MIQPLIYRYSPNNLNDFIMDNDLHELIRSRISMDNINLILYGNQGTGKTKKSKRWTVFDTVALDPCLPPGEHNQPALTK